MHCKMVGSILRLYSLDDTVPPPVVTIKKYTSILSKFPWGAKSSLEEENCPTVWGLDLNRAIHRSSPTVSFSRIASDAKGYSTQGPAPFQDSPHPKTN